MGSSLHVMVILGIELEPDAFSREVVRERSWCSHMDGHVASGLEPKFCPECGQARPDPSLANVRELDPEALPPGVLQALVKRGVIFEDTGTVQAVYDFEDFDAVQAVGEHTDLISVPNQNRRFLGKRLALVSRDDLESLEFDLCDLFRTTQDWMYPEIQNYGIPNRRPPKLHIVPFYW